MRIRNVPILFTITWLATPAGWALPYLVSRMNTVLLWKKRRHSGSGKVAPKYSPASETSYLCIARGVSPDRRRLKAETWVGLGRLRMARFSRSVYLEGSAVGRLVSKISRLSKPYSTGRLRHNSPDLLRAIAGDRLLTLGNHAHRTRKLFLPLQSTARLSGGGGSLWAPNPQSPTSRMLATP